MANEIEIVVRVKDQAAAGMAAVKEEVKAGGAAAAEEASKSGEKIGENLTNGLTKDSSGRLRNAMGRFASDLEKEAAGLGSKGVEIPVKLPTGDFEAEFRAAMEDADRESAKASQAIRQSFGAVESGSRSLRAAMAELEPAADEAGTGIEDAGNKSASAGSSASNSGNGFHFLATKLFWAASGAIALGPALAAIPAAAGAAAVGAGALALGFGGVIKALHDYGTQSEATGQSSASLAQTAFSNALAIRNGEAAIADAKKQAAVAAENSAAAIVSAQQHLVESAYGVQQAEQSLANAQHAEKAAQDALTQARKDAVNQLADLNNATADASLAVEESTNNLTKAKDAERLVDQNSLSTAQQKIDAALAVREAQRALIDAQQRSKEATQASDDANKKGVNGLAGVVSAQDAATQAAQATAAAQHGVGQAMQAQVDAQNAVSKAVQDQARQQVSSNEAISKAVQNLADTYKQQQLAAAAAAASGSAAANKFQQDFAALSPAGQAFVNQLLGMKGGLKSLADTAQTTMLPGFTQLLKDVAGPNGLGSLFNNAVGTMGGIIGDTAGKFGALMTTPAFKGQLAQILKDGAGFARQFADGLLSMVGGLTAAVSKAGPLVDAIGGGLKGLMSSGIPAFFQGLTTNAQGSGQTIKGLVDMVSSLLGPLGTLVGGLSGALGPAIQILAPIVGDLGKKITDALMPAMGPLSDALAAAATFIGQVVMTLQPLLPMIATVLVGALKVATPLLKFLADVLQENHKWIMPLAGVILAVVAAIKAWAIVQAAINLLLTANPIGLIVVAIAGLVAGLVYCWNHFAGFRDFLKDTWKFIKDAFDEFLGFVKKWWPELLAPFTLGISEIVKHWDSIVDFVKKLPGRLLAAGASMWNWVRDKFDEATGWVSGKWDALVSTVSGLPGKFAAAGGHMWDWVKETFKGAINTVIGWWNNLSFGIPKVHVPGTNWDVGGGTIGVPTIPLLKAAGGPIGTGGLAAIIGEAGIEATRLPNGSVVMPHANTAAMFAGGAGSATAPTRLEAEWVGGGGDEFLTWLKKNIRIRAGNGSDSVQRALGQAY